MAKLDKPFKFEEALAELNQLVNTMESGDISLEDSLKHFERGIQLTRQCQKALEEAQQKISILSEKENLEPYTPQDED
jgi:exodeoxyribonuclease VII small subunit